MCGEMGKAVLRALTGALLCGLVSDAAYLQRWQDEYEEPTSYHQSTYHQPSYHQSSYHQPSYHQPSYHQTSYHQTSHQLPESTFEGHGGYKNHHPTSKIHTKKPEFLVVMDKHFFGKLKDDVPLHIPSFAASSNSYLKKITPFQYERSPYLTYKYPQQHSNYPAHYDEPHINFNHKPLREAEKPQDLRNVPGHPGIDYPIYHSVPETGFSCSHVPVHPGMYANVETGCQAYHVCHDGREGHQGASFLCTNGTLFDQEKFACDWWYNVDCSQAVAHYKLNADPLKNPYVPKPKLEDIEHQDRIYYKRQ